MTTYQQGGPMKFTATPSIEARLADLQQRFVTPSLPREVVLGEGETVDAYVVEVVYGPHPVLVLLPKRQRGERVELCCFHASDPQTRWLFETRPAVPGHAVRIECVRRGTAGKPILYGDGADGFPIVVKPRDDFVRYRVETGKRRVLTVRTVRALQLFFSRTINKEVTDSE